MKLSGQVGIVTGAGRGIGTGIALALAREGMAVTVVSRNGANRSNHPGELCKFEVRAFAIRPCVRTAIRKEARALLVGRTGKRGRSDL